MRDRGKNRHGHIMEEAGEKLDHGRKHHNRMTVSLTAFSLTFTVPALKIHKVFLINEREFPSFVEFKPYSLGTNIFKRM